jgi:K+-sensing histidine kinase KdpD
MPRFRDQVALVASLLAPLAVAAALVPLRNTSFSGADAALVLVVVVVAVSANGHRVAGALAALSSAVWFDFFLTQPYQRFTVTTSADITTIVLLLIVGVTVSQLAARARRLQVVAITDAAYLAMIHQTAQLVQSGAAANAVVRQVETQLVDLLQLRACRFQYGNLLGHPPRLEHDGSIVKGRNSWDIDRLGLPDEEIELRVSAGGRFYGRFMLTPQPGAAPSLQARLVAVTLADQAGAAFDTSRTGHNPA